MSYRYSYTTTTSKVASLLFFFSSRRRHTRLVSDWSSDVCSSDLDGSGRMQEQRDTKCRRQASALGALAGDCSAGIQDQLSALLASQTTSPASTRVDRKSVV